MVLTIDKLIIIIFFIQVDSQICEQIFSWLSGYARITQHMQREYFLIYLCDQHNQKLWIEF